MWRRFGGYFERRDIRRRVEQGDVFAVVEQKLRNEVRVPRKRWNRHTDFTYLDQLIDEAIRRTEYIAADSDSTQMAATWLEALALQAPRAAMAQIQMDKHKHSYHNRDARVLELIDFNDAYVQAVLTSPQASLHDFNNNLRHLIDWFCKRVGAWTFSDEQFEAITHGLSREIAVFNSVRAAGFEVKMTNRAEDALGIDMIIVDKLTNKHLNVDTKTNSSFHYRLIELLREGRLSGDDIDLAERRGFTQVVNGHGVDKVRVVLWRIDEASLGKINDFSFSDSNGLINELALMFKQFGE